MTRFNWIGAPEMFNLDAACRPIADAFGHCVYLVGSALERRDYRDVDVRCILDDNTFDQMFPDRRTTRTAWLNPREAILDAAMAGWLQARTGLPIDFQFQRRSEANAEFGGKPRHPLGLALLASDAMGDTEVGRG